MSEPRKGWLARGQAAETAVVAAGQRRRGPSPTVLALALLTVLAVIALWQVPRLQVAQARDRLASEEQLTFSERLVLENDLFQAENAARTTLALILAASGLLLAVAIVWRRFEISSELRTHERFARAIEQLGSERGDGTTRTEARLGGIYALEALLQESEREYWPVMEVLTAYVRENAAWKPGERAAGGGPTTPAADIQAIMSVLGRRPAHAAAAERRLLDLRETDLRSANLSGSRLDGMTFQGAHLNRVDATRATLTRSNLREADLSGASLTEAHLEGASLSRANLEGARLNGANLKRADLSGATLRGADLWDANLTGCNLKDADLRGADLSQCALEDAILWRADLQDAVLTGARLRGTHLERASLAGATGLTWEQGEDAFTDENTILPEYLVPEHVRQTVAAVTHQAATPSPTPAARRAATQHVVARPAPAPPPPPPPPEPMDNVVQLKRTRPRTRTTRPSPEITPQPKPKKSSLPKHRKPGLVKPA